MRRNWKKDKWARLSKSHHKWLSQYVDRNGKLKSVDAVIGFLIKHFNDAGGIM